MATVLYARVSTTDQTLEHQRTQGSTSSDLGTVLSGGFSRFVDILVLSCAVLFFSVGSIVVMGAIPPLPLAAILLLASSAIFVTVYHLIFSDFLCGASPGKRLAGLAAAPPADSAPLDRFR